MELGGPEIAPVVTFPPSLPSRSQRHLSAWLFWKAICNGWFRRCAGDRSATIAIISKQTKVCRRSRLHLMGDAGWEDRFSDPRSEEHTSELQSLMRISYAVFCLKKKKSSIKTNTLTK